MALAAPNPAVTLGPNNELRDVLVYVSSKLPSQDEPWVHSSYAESAKQQLDYDQKKCIFLPQCLPCGRPRSST